MQSLKVTSKGNTLPQIDNKTNAFTQRSKGLTSFLNISTKFNGIGGSKLYWNRNNDLDTSSLAIKKQKVQPKLPKTGIFKPIPTEYNYWSLKTLFH